MRLAHPHWKGSRISFHVHNKATSHLAPKKNWELHSPIKAPARIMSINNRATLPSRNCETQVQMVSTSLMKNIGMLICRVCFAFVFYRQTATDSRKFREFCLCNERQQFGLLELRDFSQEVFENCNLCFRQALNTSLAQGMKNIHIIGFFLYNILFLASARCFQQFSVAGFLGSEVVLGVGIGWCGRLLGSEGFCFLLSPVIA